MAAALNLLIGGPIALYVVGFALGCVVARGVSPGTSATFPS